MYANVRPRCDAPESDIMSCISYISFLKNLRVFMSVMEIAAVWGGDGWAYTTAANTFRLCVGHPFSCSFLAGSDLISGVRVTTLFQGNCLDPGLLLKKIFLVRIFFQLDGGIIDKVTRYFKCKTWWFNVYIVKMYSSSSLTLTRLSTFFQLYFPHKFQLYDTALTVLVTRLYITYSMGMNLSKLGEMVEDRGTWCAAVRGVEKSQT